MIIEKFIQQGNVLFRHRSFLPWMILPLGIYYGYQYTLLHDAIPDNELDMMLMGLFLSLLGFALRAITVGYTPSNTSGRNTTAQKADVLNTTGIYSLMRHPLYVANYLVFMGFVVVFCNLSFILIATLLFFLYYERIAAAEEDFLSRKFGEAYAQWSHVTPAFFPSLTRWKKPSLPFSFRKVLRREPPGFLLICCYFFCVEFAEDVLYEQISLKRWAAEESLWLILLAVGIAWYGCSKILRKKTSLLEMR